MRIRIAAVPLGVCLAQIVLAGPSLAGGLYLNSFATPSQGTASAGANAIADDASTAFHNAAGMTRLDGHQLSAGLSPGFTQIEFDADSTSPSGGGDGGNQGGFVPIIGSHYVHKLSERWRLGMSLVSVSGAVLDPENDWAGRNEVTKLSLFTLTLMPTVGVRVTDWLSLGAGAAITYGRLNFNLRAPVLSEPEVKLKGLDDWAFAPIASVLLEFTPELRLGVTYQGESDFDLGGKVEIPPGVDAGIDLDLDLAQAVRASLYWDAGDRLALMLSGGWEDWSVAKNLPVSVSAGSAAIPLGFHDTWYLAGGVHYRVADGWTLQTGVRYDSSALKDGDRTTAFPIDRVWTLGVGARHEFSDNLDLGFNFVWTDLGNAPVQSPFVSGDYSSNDLFLFGVSLSFKQLPWSGKLSF